MVNIATTADTVADPTASFADLNEEFERGETALPESPGYSAPEGTFGEIDFSSTIIDSSSDSSAEIDPREAMLRQELESVDFYISQGYLDIAVDTLDMLEHQFQAHPEIEARRQQLSELSQPAPAGGVIAGSEADKPEPAATPMHFDAAPVMEDEPAAPPPENVPSGNPQTRPSLDSGLADVFEEFRVAEEGNDAGADDFETHYNMGLAYKEMDLLDEAVREFQAAAALVSGADGTPRFLRSCNMLGHCFMQKSLPKAAAIWFKKGLAAPGHSDHEYQALRFELASAYEQMGDVTRAIDAFTEVYSIDVSYRGVAEKLKSLQARRDGNKGGKKKK